MLVHESQGVFNKQIYELHSRISGQRNKLDGVGPVDNRPSTNKLYHFVRKKEEKNKNQNKKIETCDMWHVTCDT